MALSSLDFVSPIDLIAVTTAFLGKIDLDPASSRHANLIVGADKYFSWEQNGLLQKWKADTLYLYPPRDFLLKAEQPKSSKLWVQEKMHRKSCQRVWLELAYHKWLRQEFSEGIIFLTSTEVALRTTQKIGMDLPMCILKDRPQLYEDNAKLKKVNSRCIGVVLYLTPQNDYQERLQMFQSSYSDLGRVYL